MKKNNLAIVLGITILLIGGIVLVVSSQMSGIGMFYPPHEDRFGSDNLSHLNVKENATREEIENALWEKRLDELGLTEDSTIQEFREAMKKQMDMTHNDSNAPINTKEFDRSNKTSIYHNVPFDMPKRFNLPGNSFEFEMNGDMKNQRKENENFSEMGPRPKGMNPFPNLGMNNRSKNGSFGNFKPQHPGDWNLSAEGREMFPCNLTTPNPMNFSENMRNMPPEQESMGEGVDLGNIHDLNLSENATREEIEDALWEKRLEKLGLTEDSTVKEFREAMEERIGGKGEFAGGPRMGGRMGRFPREAE